MSISSISIERPVLTLVSSIVIVLFGVIGFTYLGVREFPAVDPPTITVSANYVGANADVIESKITEPLEESLNGIAGVRSLTSISKDGASTITVEFELGIELEAAANDVRDRVSRTLRLLPPDADPPVVTKSDANSDAILVVTVQSKQRDLLEVCDIATNVIKERLQTIAGVSEIRIWGEKKYAMRLWLDPMKLTAYRLTALDIKSALDRENVELPSGSVEGTNTELTVRTMGRLVTVDDFNSLIIKQDGNNIVRFLDIGRAEIGAENLKTILKTNGVPMFGVAITPQPGANHVSIAKDFYKRVAEIKADLPPDIEIGVLLDTTKGIQDSITEVVETLLISFGLVAFIIFIFLRNWRTTLIPVLAIPISLIGTFFLMYVMDFSINVLTLLGIVLATGLVVDDAIVVLENIYTKVEEGISPLEAAHKGSKEIVFAVLSTTITLAAVFLPIVFLQGLTGRLFREFGVVVAGSVLISAFVSLTLTPMMSSRFIRPHSSHGKFYEWSERILNNIIDSYRLSLEGFMRHRWVAFVIIVLSVAAIFGFGGTLGSELAPIQDKSRMRISSTGPEGATFDYMDTYITKLSKIMSDSVPEMRSSLTVTSPGFSGASSTNQGFMRLMLTEPNERRRTQQDIAEQVTKLLKQLPDAKGIVIQEQTISAGGGGASSGLPVQYVLQTSTLDKLKNILPRFLEEAAKNPAFSVVDVNLKFTKPELLLEIDRDKARALNVSVLDIAQTLQAAFSGQRFGYVILDGKQYQVIGQAERSGRNDPLDLKSLYVRTASGQLIQLDNIVRLTEKSTPPQLFHYNRYVSATVSAGLAKGKTIGDGIEAMKEVSSQVLDESFSTSLTGASKDFAESSSSLLFAFVLALVLIYLVLAAQFESFVDPFIILLTVPLALAGALFSLWYFAQTLNIFSEIGIIMLIGLVTKNAILIVEFANQRKMLGLSVKDAVLGAAVSRFRPIIMTTLATVLGALPIALALGAGSKSRISMGIVVIGGLMLSLVLTLYAIPALYSFFSKQQPVKEGMNE
ncbi:MAG: efflux RND transporter permease subunit [Ignavibacteria bacterium]|nr:efflux RND transporter permease subunit [Ignavibacteria bacterium]